jgi:acetyl esterase/lipase
MRVAAKLQASVLAGTGRVGAPCLEYLMPVGYLIPVVLISWSVACALTTWRRLGPVAALPALLVNELPFIVGLWLATSTALALAVGDVSTRSGKAVFGVAVIAGAGLVVIVLRALKAHGSLGMVGPAQRPWARIVRAPFFPGRRNIVQARNLPYAAGRGQRLDVYYRRDRPIGAPVLVNLHGGGFRSGSKSREALPLIRHLVSRRGFVCISADYRLQPHVQLEDQVADVRLAIRWAGKHAGEFGADPSRLMLTGSSAGAYLAVQAVLDGEQGVGAVVGRYGYYGQLAPTGDMPDLLLIHGDHDLLIPPNQVRAFAERVRRTSSHRVRYAQIPGAHHDFDMFESIRAAAVAAAVEQFLDEVAAHS